MKKLVYLLLACFAMPCLAEDTLDTSYDVDGTLGNYEYVNLGLPSGTRWATYNIGATNPYELGQRFAWGEVESRDNFTVENYHYFVGYEDVDEPGTVPNLILEDLGEDISGGDYDAALHLWGEGWRLPNDRDIYELYMYCWWDTYTEGDIKGVKIYGRTGHSIFLPLTILYSFTSDGETYNYYDALYWSGAESDYLKSDTEGFTPTFAKAISSNSAGVTIVDTKKYNGAYIRPVYNPHNTGVKSIADDDKAIVISYQNNELRILGSDATYKLSIYDLSGRLVEEYSKVSKACQLGSLSNGVYIVSLSEDSTVIKNQKIIVK